ncbi:MAG TPA: heat-inducible transcriptional repressor HrcA [Candidatus Dormibacteraeota bacterium]|nr:heat-inducible transcriptional repressor HrcA [Candidatus Dormibacteraeota bacterium]
MNQETLSERHEKVLAEVVRAYIESGQPVSSRAIVRRHAEHLSPATIRNVMADLEDSGYLCHPHTSAGRLPTAAGYRYFIDRFAALAQVSQDDELWIRREMDSATSFDQAFERAGHILAKVSHGLGWILCPPLSRSSIKHIRFLLMPDGRVLVVLISEGGRARDKIIRTECAFTQAELDRIAGDLNRHYPGWTIEAIRVDLTRRLARDQDSYGHLAARAILLCDPNLLEEDVARQLYLEGAAEIVAAPEFADPGRLSDLMAAIEEKRRLVDLLSSCIETPEPVSVRIGLSEMAVAGSSLVLISAPFGDPNRAPGTLGILGPLRMDYERAITAAAFLAKHVSSTLSGVSTP